MEQLVRVNTIGLSDVALDKSCHKPANTVLSRSYWAPGLGGRMMNIRAHIVGQSPGMLSELRPALPAERSPPKHRRSRLDAFPVASSCE